MADTTTYAWDLDRTTLRFPDPAIQVVDERFSALIVGHEVVERLWTGGRWLEGPVWFGDGRYLLFSDIPNNRMLRWDEETGEVTPFRVPSNNSNGNTRDRQGRLITCEHLTRRVTRTEHDGRITVLLDAYDGKPLNAPNDLVAHSDGSIWFTDPGCGIDGNYEGDKAVKELPRDVYRIDVGRGGAEVVITGMDRPERDVLLPRRDPALRRRRRSDPGVRHRRRPAGERPGVRRHRSAGTPTGSAATGTGTSGRRPGTAAPRSTACTATPRTARCSAGSCCRRTCANLCFGGVKKNRLFMTASRSLYSVYVEALGDQTP